MFCAEGYHRAQTAHQRQHQGRKSRSICCQRGLVGFATRAYQFELVHIDAMPKAPNTRHPHLPCSGVTQHTRKLSSHKQNLLLIVRLQGAHSTPARCSGQRGFSYTVACLWYTRILSHQGYRHSFVMKELSTTRVAPCHTKHFQSRYIWSKGSTKIIAPCNTSIVSGFVERVCHGELRRDTK